jgi:hypothetical protein
MQSCTGLVLHMISGLASERGPTFGAIADSRVVVAY